MSYWRPTCLPMASIPWADSSTTRLGQVPEVGERLAAPGLEIESTSSRGTANRQSVDDESTDRAGIRPEPGPLTIDISEGGATCTGIGDELY